LWQSTANATAENRLERRNPSRHTVKYITHMKSKADWPGKHRPGSQTAVIRIRLLDKEKRAWSAEAKRSKLSLSEWLRALAARNTGPLA
jgi:hypothetical protein